MQTSQRAAAKRSTAQYEPTPAVVQRSAAKEELAVKKTRASARAAAVQPPPKVSEQRDSSLESLDSSGEDDSSGAREICAIYKRFVSFAPAVASHATSATKLATPRALAPLHKSAAASSEPKPKRLHFGSASDGKRKVKGGYELKRGGPERPRFASAKAHAETEAEMGHGALAPTVQRMKRTMAMREAKDKKEAAALNAQLDVHLGRSSALRQKRTAHLAQEALTALVGEQQRVEPRLEAVLGDAPSAATRLMAGYKELRARAERLDAASVEHQAQKARADAKIQGTLEGVHAKQSELVERAARAFQAAASSCRSCLAEQQMAERRRESKAKRRKLEMMRQLEVLVKGGNQSCYSEMDE